MSHSSNINIKWLKGKQLQEELENQKIIVDKRENHAGMIRTLEYEIAKETQSKKIGRFTNVI
ncbi:6427_t:CDS:2 [Funneliformis mosseae]|uniref:6427_t:CDS:1 n=1 Tax=Funneliformis mosseae TaxID=27381 RepID=A0A9N8Z0E0_FUNMO|nr:6427_t:CDS:2 [Funneliformis mosseae]